MGEGIGMGGDELMEVVGRGRGGVVSVGKSHPQLFGGRHTTWGVWLWPGLHNLT